jgi:ribonuclease HII
MRRHFAAMADQLRDTLPGFAREDAWAARGLVRIAGVDEAGRGPIAGPVVAAAVVLDRTCVPYGLDDSKKLTPESRAALHDQILATAEVGIGIADVARIDTDNILAAAMWAMVRAVAGLARPPDLALIDGNRLPRLPVLAEALVGGDATSASIAAASIVAKVTRDRLMDGLARDFPTYGFERHRGYATAAHLAALRSAGPCPQHRRSFAPVRALIGDGAAL